MTSIPNDPRLLRHEGSPPDSGPASIYTLHYHQRFKRYLITSEPEPTPDFIEQPGEESYKTFGGRLDFSQDVHEIGRANTADELKQFVMVMNTVVHFEPSIAENVSFYLRLCDAFKNRFNNLITDLN